MRQNNHILLRIAKTIEKAVMRKHLKFYSQIQKNRDLVKEIKRKMLSSAKKEKRNIKFNILRKDKQ
jgi:hypothetical protein